MENKTISLYPNTLVDLQRASGMRLNSGLYFDKANEKAPSFGESVGDKFNASVIVEAGSKPFDQTAKFDELMNAIMAKRNALLPAMKRMNAAQFPSDYYDYVNLLRLYITRRRADFADLSSRFAQESVNPNASKSVLFDEFKPYMGAFEEVQGRGDAVPMIEHTSGREGSAVVKLYALGDSRTLEDELFNLDIYELQKVLDAFTRAYIAKRNDLSVGRLVAYTTATAWQTDQQQAADSASATAELKLYVTLNNAIEKLRGLKDPLTGQYIDASRMVLVTSYVDERRINRVINGQLENTKGTSLNLTPLSEIMELWPYQGDVIAVGTRTNTYAGVSQNKAYLIVPGAYNAPNYILTKRAMTYEVGRGDILTLARDERVAYFAQAEYNKEFFGHSGGEAAGTGYAVEVTLPSA
jgi:hypothetical protein